MNLEKDMAGTLTGLNQRGSRWYINIVVPPDLREVYGKRAMNIALGTSDSRAATVLGTMKRAQWLAEFSAKRREAHPEPLAVVNPELAQELAVRVRARVLQQDDSLRDNPELIGKLTAARKSFEKPLGYGLTIPTDAADTLPEHPNADLPNSVLDGLNDDDVETLRGLNTLLDARAGADLAKRRRAAVLPLVRFEAMKLGLAFDPTAEGAQEALAACLLAYRKARQEVSMRDAGEVVPTPELPIAKPTHNPAKPRTLRDVFDRWKVSGDKPRTADSIAAYDRALRQFEGQHPGLALEAVTREIGDVYRTWLRMNCATPKTARDRLNALKSLLKFAAETLEWTTKQPWRGLDIKAPTTNKRRPWTDDELMLMFSSPLHTAYSLPDARYGGREAAYWIPLLGLFTGTRLGELCQLRAIDVQEVEGTAVLVLTNEGEGQSIKSDAGHRSVPIHSELIRLGFLGYVDSIKATGADSLWPSLPLRDGKPSDFFGRWFRAHRKALGISGTRPDFHCFRHTVRPLMRRAGHSEGTMDKVTGHKTLGSVGTVVYDHRTLAEVRDAVEAIRYPALRLPKVSPTP
jgi:integrase